MFQFFLVVGALLVITLLLWLSRKFDERFGEKDSPALKLEQANMIIGSLKALRNTDIAEMLSQKAKIEELTEQFEKLRFAKISGDVKLGQKAEHLLPFLEAFPYKDDEIKGLFQPVDLIVFRQDEIVFVEIKTGAASLTEKERRIRDNIKAGRVRFEVHRLNEKGVTIK